IEWATEDISYLKALIEFNKVYHFLPYPGVAGLIAVLISNRTIFMPQYNIIALTITNKKNIFRPRAEDISLLRRLESRRIISILPPVPGKGLRSRGAVAVCLRFRPAERPSRPVPKSIRRYSWSLSCTSEAAR